MSEAQEDHKLPGALVCLWFDMLHELFLRASESEGILLELLLLPLRYWEE